MNREIKFRVWECNKKYIFTLYDLLNARITIGHGYTKFPPMHDELIIQQYIGINDSLGKEIYEGDIVKFNDSEINSKPVIGNFEVYYETDLTLVGSPCFALWNNKGAVFQLLGHIEVIGNIFENKELL